MNARLSQIYLLTALTLLIAGLFQPLLAAHGPVCARLHSAAEAPATAAGAGASIADATDSGQPAQQHGAPEHRHDLPSDSHHSGIGAPASPCSAPALIAPSALLDLAESVTQRLAAAELPPVNSDLPGLFRPPRLG